MPDIVLLFIGIAFTLFTLVAIVISAYDLRDGTFHASLSFLLIFAMLSGSVGSFTWLYKACNYNRAVAIKETLPISTVTYPDGSTVQTVQIDPLTKWNVTTHFGKVFPEGSTLDRVHYSPWAMGVYNVMDDYWYYQQPTLPPVKK